MVLVFPAQLHEGDRFTDAAGDEWQVASRPVTYKQGHEVRARVQRPAIRPPSQPKQYPARRYLITVPVGGRQ